MRRTTLGVLVGLSLAVCCDADATQVPTPQALWQRIEVLQEHHALMLGSKPRQPGSREVDVHTTDLANAAANAAIRRAEGIGKVVRYPDGALVIKENYDAQGRPTGITAMLKLDGYDQTDRNWVMAAYKPDGQSVAYGEVPACIACHAMVRHQDFVFAPPPRQLLPVTAWKAFFPGQKISSQYLRLLRDDPSAVIK